MPKHLLATLALLLTPLLPAQQTTPSPNLAGIAHVALRVHDLQASIVFYEKLGFVKAFDLSRDGKVYEAFIKINDHQFIEIYPVDAKNTQVGFLHLCFEGKDLNAVHDYYVSKGLTPNAVRTAGSGNLLFTMPGPATPQGPHNMEYTQYMAGSLHSKDIGQHLGSDRISTLLTSVAIAAEDPKTAAAFYREKIGFQNACFKVQPCTQLRIRGGQGTIAFEPASALGFKARITLGLATADAVAKAEQQLTAHKVSFTKDGLGDPSITDPDGNEIDLRSPHVY